MIPLPGLEVGAVNKCGCVKDCNWANVVVITWPLLRARFTIWLLVTWFTGIVRIVWVAMPCDVGIRSWAPCIPCTSCPLARINWGIDVGWGELRSCGGVAWFPRIPLVPVAPKLRFNGVLRRFCDGTVKFCKGGVDCSPEWKRKKSIN